MKSRRSLVPPSWAEWRPAGLPPLSRYGVPAAAAVLLRQLSACTANTGLLFPSRRAALRPRGDILICKWIAAQICQK